MLSAYDPRDLFSEDPDRLAKALRALLATPNVSGCSRQKEWVQAPTVGDASHQQGGGASTNTSTRLS